MNEINTNLNTNLTNINTKLDIITTRIHYQDMKISDLGQRVESQQKHLTYADAVKLPPQPLPQPNTNSQPNTNTNTNTNKQTNTNANTNKVTIKQKNDNLTPEELMNRSRNIVGIFPIQLEYIERNKGDTKAKTLMSTATEFL